MESATTQDSSDSIAASTAMVKPLGSCWRSRSKLSCGMAKRGAPPWMEYRSPMVLTLRFKPETRAIPASTATSEADALGHARPQHQDRQARQADGERLHVKGSQVLHHASELIHELDGRGARRIGKPHKILELTDDDGDDHAGGKARGDGMRNKADERAQAHDAHNYQQHARDDGSRHQSAHAVGRHDTGDDGGERRRGTGDLYAC